MDNLDINSIPIKILARIILQIPTLPVQENVDLIPILTAGLAQYGNSSDMNAFLNYCTSQVTYDKPWLWEQYEIKSAQDWEIANNKKKEVLVGLRFLLTLEASRGLIELTRLSKNNTFDPKHLHFYQGRAIPIDSILKDTLSYFKTEKTSIDPLIEKLVGLRIEALEKDKDDAQKQLSQLDQSDYHLMGALMVRYDSTINRGYTPRSWCLYLRDYIENENGTTWRIILDDEENRASSDQVLADLRGTVNNNMTPSNFSRDYRPAYLFYGNLDALQKNNTEDQNQVITFEDYTFDDDYEYEQPAEEDERCMHCGIEDIVDNVNDMFFCEKCNRGVHQLCEDPPIQTFEKNVDPWFCRTCCRSQNLPFPTPPLVLDSNSVVDGSARPFALDSKSLADSSNPPSIKRKREDEDHDEIARNT